MKELFFPERHSSVHKQIGTCHSLRDTTRSGLRHSARKVSHHEALDAKSSGEESSMFDDPVRMSELELLLSKHGRLDHTGIQLEGICSNGC
jgi:hypothetical protein